MEIFAGDFKAEVIMGGIQRGKGKNNGGEL